jgi:hypothetical protein
MFEINVLNQEQHFTHKSNLIPLIEQYKQAINILKNDKNIHRD